MFPNGKRVASQSRFAGIFTVTCWAKLAMTLFSSGELGSLEGVAGAVGWPADLCLCSVTGKEEARRNQSRYLAVGLVWVERECGEREAVLTAAP